MERQDQQSKLTKYHATMNMLPFDETKKTNGDRQALKIKLQSPSFDDAN